MHKNNKNTQNQEKTGTQIIHREKEERQETGKYYEF